MGGNQRVEIGGQLAGSLESKRRNGAASQLTVAAFAALIGLSAGTAGSGNPRGNCQWYASAACATATSIAHAAPSTARRAARITRPRSRLRG